MKNTFHSGVGNFAWCDHGICHSVCPAVCPCMLFDSYMTHLLHCCQWP